MRKIKQVGIPISAYSIPGILMNETYTLDKARLTFVKVCKHYHVTEDELRSGDRSAHLTYIRQMYAYFVFNHFKEKATKKYQSIGMVLGGRDRTTAMNMVLAFKERFDTDGPLPRLVESTARRTKADYLNTFKHLQLC